MHFKRNFALNNRNVKTRHKHCRSCNVIICRSLWNRLEWQIYFYLTFTRLNNSHHQFVISYNDYCCLVSWHFRHFIKHKSKSNCKKVIIVKLIMNICVIISFTFLTTIESTMNYVILNSRIYYFDDIFFKKFFVPLFL